MASARVVPRVRSATTVASSARAGNRLPHSSPNDQVPTPNHFQLPTPKNSQLLLGIGSWKWLGVGSWDLGVERIDGREALRTTARCNRRGRIRRLFA